VVSKAASPQPKPPPATSTPAKVVSPDPTLSSITSSLPTASPQQTSQSIESIPVKVPATSEIPLPAANPIATTADEAWIKLEVKPVAPPSKPLGTPAPPPTTTNLESSSQSPAVVPEIITKKIPTDPTPTTTELESENWT
jgi:hypothetical protein